MADVKRLKFWRKIAENSVTGCWEYMGQRNKGGYGLASVWAGGRAWKGYTHRIAYKTFNGPIDEDLQVDHLCRNKACCNPDHLELVEKQENEARARKAWRARRGERA